MITVDGDTSTNDMVLVMANHQLNTKYLSKTIHNGKHLLMHSILLYVLAKAIARDGEGNKVNRRQCVRR